MSAIAERVCAWCGGGMEGKRPHAVYCTRTCKTKASDRRRVEDGRDRGRYWSNEKRREYCKAQAKRYLADNPEKMRLIRRRYKGQVLGEVYSFTERDWVRLVARFRGCCAYCGKRAELQREHVIPLSRGGGYSVGNTIPACGPCNASKGNQTLTEWRLRQMRSGGR